MISWLQPYLTYRFFYSTGRIQGEFQLKLLFFVFSAPGGIISTEGENGEAKVRTNICLFGLADSMEKVKAFEQVFVKLMRR